jgi:hypothetical protein
MSTLVAGAVVATAMLSNCSWNHPGRNPYRGTVSAAVSRYVDIPAPVRKQLIAKIESGKADDTAAIMRDSIAGKYDYSPQITDMHFGERTVCGSVTRDQWVDTAREQAKVYCVDNHCLSVPRICGNISRVQRIAGAGGGTVPGGGAMPAAVAVPRTEAPGLVRAASPDDVASADAMAGMVASGAPHAMIGLSAFASPFASASRAPDLTDRNPGLGTELTQPAPASPVPEPSTLGMLGAGLAVLFGAQRLRRRNVKH